MAETPAQAHALDHAVVVLFENRSLENVFGRLYGPDDQKSLEGVLGKDLTNPIPEWAEHGADRIGERRSDRQRAPCLKIVVSADRSAMRCGGRARRNQRRSAG
jgi:hypothetical protein